MSDGGSSAQPNADLTREDAMGWWRHFKAHRSALWSGWFLCAVLVLVCAWPVLEMTATWIGPSTDSFAGRLNPDRVSDAQFQPPSFEHWFGTDVHGRDLFARVVAGARVSLAIGVAGAALSVAIGALWGAIAGYFGGRVDSSMMRTVDVLYAMPTVIFVIVVVTSLEEFWTGILAAVGLRTLTGSARMLFVLVVLAGISWLTVARIVRGQVLTIREKGFVQASRALGTSPWHVLRWHILPNTLGVVLAYAALTVPAVILYESFLSYLGLGVQPPMASWGSLLAEGADQLNPFRVYWWLIVFPGAGLVLVLLALTLVGEGLRDCWDRERR